MQEIRSSNSPGVTGFCDLNKSQARHHRSLKLGSKLKYLNRSIKLVPTEKRKIYFTSELNFQTKTFFTENLLAIEMREIQILINKSVYLGLSILDLNC